ncbi:LysR substrate-binding domain-containing protein [Pseudomonas sp. Marseille-QA0892]
MTAYPALDSDLLRTFVAIVDTGGFTRAAEVVSKTQSAVSMQIKRLEEDVVRRPVFRREGRQLSLTTDGEILLDYARRILKLQGEVINSFRAPDMRGVVRIGTPDDYVMRFMPGILSRFAAAYPLVQVELHCESTVQLLQRRDLDLTIVTREPGMEIGQMLRQERMVWAEAAGFAPHEHATIPLAMFNSDCFGRKWACEVLERIGRPYRIAYTSPSLAALFAVTQAGLAVTAQLESLIPSDMRILSEADGLPEMQTAKIMLVRAPGRQNAVTECLAGHIVEGFRL